MTASRSTASQTFRVGDSFFGQLVTCDGVTIMESSGPYVIPPREKVALIDFRERMKESVEPPTPETLGTWDMELREAYLGITDALVYGRPPALQNTDGEDIEFHRLTFEVGSAQEAFDALKHLAWEVTERELLEDAEMDEQGRVRRVSFSWTVAGNRAHAEWDNTVLGHIDIDGTRLVADLNSAERSARFPDIVEESLGEAARHAGTEVQSVEEAMLERDERGDTSEPGESPDLAEHPEVQKKIREMMVAHYESWLTHAIPALDGLSPLEAVKDPVGREKVKALVEGIEQTGRTMEPPLDEAVIRSLHQRLGLS